MTTLAQRVRERRLALGLKKGRELARLANVHPNIIQGIEAGKLKKSKYLPSIAKALKTTETYLLTGGGVTDAQASYPLLGWDQIEEKEHLLATNSINDFVPAICDVSFNSFALKIIDDSMISLIPNTDSFYIDDIVIIDPKKRKPNAFVLARINKDYFIRKVVGSSLVALNPSYPPEKITEQVEIIGTLVSLYRLLK